MGVLCSSHCVEYFTFIILSRSPPPNNSEIGSSIPMKSGGKHYVYWSSGVTKGQGIRFGLEGRVDLPVCPQKTGVTLGKGSFHGIASIINLNYLKNVFLKKQQHLKAERTLIVYFSCSLSIS